jgi:hypothetical protein
MASVTLLSVSVIRLGRATKGSGIEPARTATVEDSKALSDQSDCAVRLTSAAQYRFRVDGTLMHDCGRLRQRQRPRQAAEKPNSTTSMIDPHENELASDQGTLA